MDGILMMISVLSTPMISYSTLLFNLRPSGLSEPSGFEFMATKFFSPNPNALILFASQRNMRARRSTLFGRTWHMSVKLAGFFNGNCSGSVSSKRTGHLLNGYAPLVVFPGTGQFWNRSVSTVPFFNGFRRSGLMSTNCRAVLPDGSTFGQCHGGVSRSPRLGLISELCGPGIMPDKEDRRQ
jgi:hypothetical protein